MKISTIFNLIKWNEDNEYSDDVIQHYKRNDFMIHECSIDW